MGWSLDMDFGRRTTFWQMEGYPRWEEQELRYAATEGKGRKFSNSCGIWRNAGSCPGISTCIRHTLVMNTGTAERAALGVFNAMCISKEDTHEDQERADIDQSQ